MRLDRAPAGFLDFLGKRRDRLGAELAGLGLQRVGGQDEAGGVLAMHRLLDLGDRFLAILAEIAEDAHEARPELGAHLRKFGPVDELVHRLFPLVSASRQSLRPGR